MKNTLRNVAWVMGLSGLQYAIASPVAPLGFAVVTETVTTTHTIKILIPASTTTSTIFQSGQPTPSIAARLDEEAPDDTRASPFTVSLSTTSIVTITSASPVTHSAFCENASTVTSYIAIEETSFITQEPVTTEVVIYPCATPLPTMIPTIPYGKFSDSLGNPGTTTGNQLFGLSTPQGASAVACCNTCWFDLTYCIAAFWFSFEGCVVNQGTVSNGLIGSGVPLTGQGVSSQCPSGTVEGLVYAMDSGADFRSTGDFAGPCGSSYQNL